MLETVALDEARGALAIIDQTRLPSAEELLFLTEPEDIRDAIYLLKVRGAPAIGVAAAIGIYLAAKAIAGRIVAGDADGVPDGADAYGRFMSAFRAAKATLNAARPTAVNLSWALERMERAALSLAGAPLPDIVERLRRECLAIKDEDARVCEAMGRNGLELLSRGMGLLTHCNAGRLATASRYGTATAPVYYGHERGYGFSVYCDETRPLLQGARLTAYELQAAGVDVTLLCDNMAPSLMAAGKIGAVLVGCDRVAANGDTANKIGTSYVAIAAKHYGIPFYVCAPTSTLDMSCPDGRAIKIEQRHAEEVTEMWYASRLAPPGVKVFNPAFDVTEAGLITAFVTEHGIARPPYNISLREICKGQNHYGQ